MENALCYSCAGCWVISWLQLRQFIQYNEHYYMSRFWNSPLHKTATTATTIVIIITTSDNHLTSILSGCYHLFILSNMPSEKRTSKLTDITRHRNHAHVRLEKRLTNFWIQNSMFCRVSHMNFCVCYVIIVSAHVHLSSAVTAIQKATKSIVIIIAYWIWWRINTQKHIYTNTHRVVRTANKNQQHLMEYEEVLHTINNRLCMLAIVRLFNSSS